MSFNLENILRENIKKLVPYSSARDEYKGTQGIFLDANENSLGSPIDDITENVNRYPDPQQLELKEKLSKVKGVPVENIFLGNGSDEAIDILFRAFCEPGKDKAIVCPPTYGMYEVSAAINDVEVKKIYSSEANFLLVKVEDPKKLFLYLQEKQIIVRERSKAPLCEGCLRITVVTKDENKKLIEALKSFK